MSGLRGILAGSLTLIVLHTLVAYKGPSRRLADLSGLAVGLVNAFLSPDRPAIPERGAAPTSTIGLGGQPVPAGTDPYFGQLPPPAPR